MNAREYWVSPSQFAWLWQECRRCWWAQATNDIARPFGLPRVLSTASDLMVQSMAGAELHQLGIAGRVVGTEHVCRSITTEVRPNSGAEPLMMRINGRCDLLVKMDDGTYHVYDVKQTQVTRDTAEHYAMQNSAYAWALQHPTNGKPLHVSGGGLVCWTPKLATAASCELVVATSAGEALYTCEHPIHEAAMVYDITVLPQELDTSQVLSTMAEMATLLRAPEAPLSSKECPYCRWLQRVTQLARRMRDDRGAHAILAERLQAQLAREEKTNDETTT